MKILIVGLAILILVCAGGCGDGTAAVPDGSADASAVITEAGVEASVPDAGVEGIVTVNDAASDVPAAD
jgi:hypothetical protein